jgi:antitoxin VapB
MAIHVQDEETDRLVRDFARRRGIGVTAAIKLAIEEASSNETRSLEMLRQRIEPLLEQVRAKKMTSVWDDKAFMDEMWGEDR